MKHLFCEVDMFTVYYSNNLTSLAAMLIQVQKVSPNPNPFESETILVQSQGMAQWLQMRIADELGVAGQFAFPFPTSFLWQQYRLLFPHLPKENIFERNTLIWRLMRLIPLHIDEPEFKVLKGYLSEEKEEAQYQLKLFQLANKIADLYDQYLVYRPHWLIHWENSELQAIFEEIKNHYLNQNKESDIYTHIQWQGTLWNYLVEEIKSDTDEDIFITSHRAYLQKQYFNKLDNLTETEKTLLPQRIFIFGISSLPATQLAVLKKLSEHIDVHLFFLNPSEIYWGDNIEDKAIEKLALKQQFSTTELDALLAQQGNQLLAMWGKQGREFFAQLVELESPQIEAFFPELAENNLAAVKNAILTGQPVEIYQPDNTIQVHACHSIMREVEVLHNKLLQLFEENTTLSPKDIIVMSSDIEQYAPYIQAVFSRYKKGDKRYIPFAISDQKISQIDPVIASFIYLISMQESQFNAEEILDLLEVNAISEKFEFNQEELTLLREWIKSAGVRMGLSIDNTHWQNFNAWENGLDRLLLGNSLKAENGVWVERIALDESYGLSAELVGKLANFLEKLTAWSKLLTESHTSQTWKIEILDFISQFYAENSESTFSLHSIIETITLIDSRITQANFTGLINIEVLQLLLQENLNQAQNQLHFLAGKVNFCTLLPMRAIPFKVVCLLGMNEGDFPRQHRHNGFDLMQFAPKKGDRAKRDDDRYLFLEALLSAQEVFYLSYIGETLTKNEPLYPSILVSQLLENLCENSESLLPSDWIKKHPMTVFSHRNQESYDNEWLQLFDKSSDFKPFLSENHLNILSDSTIELQTLIQFVQNPVKYYFNHTLGIYFNLDENIIQETEPFSLSGLENYQLLSHLVEINPEQLDTFIQEARLKGELPVAYFGEINARKLNQRITLLRETISPYLSQEAKVLSLELSLENHCQLFANVQNVYSDNVIFWRVGGLRDKDIIQLWLYHLLLSALNRKEKAKFYYLDDEQVGSFEFTPISSEEAKSQLMVYLKDYLNNEQLSIVVTQDISDYLSAEDPQTESVLEKLAEMREGEYLKRILKQTELLDYDAIYQTTKKWFDKMCISQIN